MSPDVLEAINYSRDCSVIGEELRKHWDTPKRWGLIRKYYKQVEPMILEGRRLSPYGIPLADFMTPIESAVWQEIRCYGLPFYMQYPVGRRFVDFGDPVQQIAIEVDGKAYHSPEKDAKKTAEIVKEGWQLFRISGRDAIYKKVTIAEVALCYGKDIYKIEGEEWPG